MIASDPPRVVWLITRSQGGIHDYEALLHEAGHALHYAGLDPELPFPFRRLSRDHALTEIYSFLLDSIAREPAWHAEHFGLSDAEAAENAEATRFVDALLYRRYTAKLAFELDFWDRFATDGGKPDGYEQRLTAATGIRYRAEGYLSDMDAGFYSADYLRAWIRSAQLRERLRKDVGDDWWRRARNRRRPARALPRGHPSVERGRRGSDRLRPARHRPARGRARCVSALRGLVGAELGPTRWFDVPQSRIDEFATATEDPQWIHVDPERAAAEGPFGTTVAHGFLTLALCVPMLYEVLPPAGLAINYGVNRVRFPAPVPVGSRVRGRFVVRSVEDVPGAEQAAIEATVEREGADKPVCVAELIVRSYPSL